MPESHPSNVRTMGGPNRRRSRTVSRGSSDGGDRLHIVAFDESARSDYTLAVARAEALERALRRYLKRGDAAGVKRVAARIRLVEREAEAALARLKEA